MGKKHKKLIRESFNDWDDITPEEQIRLSNELYNVTEDNIGSLLDLSDGPLLDNETGIELDVLKMIEDKFSNKDAEDAKETDSVYPDYVDTDDSKEESSDIPDSVQSVLDALDGSICINTDDVEEETDDDQISSIDTESASDDSEVDEVPETNVEEDYNRFDDVRKFKIIIRTGLGIVNFNDEIAPFSINEFEAMVKGFTNNIDVSSISPEMINLFKMALIVNRFPAALYTNEEFAALNLLDKGKFTQRETENAVFVNVLDKYVGVYFVKVEALQRFNDTIREIVDVEDDELGDPYYNVWVYLASILNSPEHSFVDDDSAVELFYNSANNEKELVEEYIIAKYIDTESDEDSDFDIIGRTNVSNKFDYIIGEILSDDDEDPEYDDYDLTDEKDAETNSGHVDFENMDADDLADILVNAVREKENNSMVVPVMHKEGNR